MTNRKVQRLARERMRQTGEPYMVARRRVMEERAASQEADETIERLAAEAEEESQ